MVEARRRLFQIVYFALYFLLAIYALRWLGGARFTQDFKIYAAAAQAALNGSSAYFPYAIGSSFVYHPVVLSFLSPVVALGGETAYAVWTIASSAAYVVLVALIAKRRGGGIAVLLILFAPFLEQLYIGQINSFVALAMVASWELAASGRDEYAGAALAVATVLKVSPGLLIIYFIARRRWRVLWGMLATLLLLTLVSVLQFGLQPLSDFITVTLKTGEAFQLSIENLGLLALMGRLGVPSAPLIHRYLLLGLLSLLTWSAWRRASAFTFALFILVILEFSPLVWLHHFVFVAAILVFIPMRTRLLRLTYVALFLIQAERLLTGTQLNGVFCTFAVGLLMGAYWLESNRQPEVKLAGAV